MALYKTLKEIMCDNIAVIVFKTNIYLDSC